MDKIFSAVADSMGSDKSVLIFMFDGKKISGGKYSSRFFGFQWNPLL